jgi:hypothetical protein
MLAATRVLSRVQAHGITLVPDGNRLRFSPASALTPELVEELRQHKEDILSILRRREEVQQDTSPLIKDASEVLQIAREVLGQVENPVTPPAPPGRDPLVKRGTDKARFFSEDWREADK